MAHVFSCEFCEISKNTFFYRTQPVGVAEGLSSQYCLICVIEKWKKSVDNGKTFTALLTDLSKAFDCLPHDLVIAKLNAYGFSLSSSSLIDSYLSNRKQRTKINSAYNSWEGILFGILQGSILVPPSFKIHTRSIFHIKQQGFC